MEDTRDYRYDVLVLHSTLLPTEQRCHSAAGYERVVIDMLVIEYLRFHFIVGC